MKQIVLGTAGHIDHGKTSLIRALTGMDTDRLAEEKRRGITIELGFAWLDLPSGQRVGIVDVPGHEKFVKNMVAGATGIDILVLVIAADEGVMPQTREHMEICQLLQIRHGLVALTKVDMVEPDWLELVTEDVHEFLEGTFLEDAAIVPVSSQTGQGLEEFTKELEDLAEKAPAPSASGLFRLPVDRVFTMKGFGTVITGTLISGKVAVGDPVELYPSGAQSKVRGIQVHNAPVTEAVVGQRTAINFQGLSRSEVERGDVVAAPGSLKSSYMVDVMLSLLPSMEKPLKNRAKVRFHTGTSEIMGKVVLLDREELLPGETGPVQMRLDRPVATVKDDRFVLRSYSPVHTIGGGAILNPIARKHKAGRPESVEAVKALEQAGPEDLAALSVFNAGPQGAPFAELLIMTNLAPKKLTDTLNRLSSTRTVILADKETRAYLHAEVLDSLTGKAKEVLTGYHEANPMKPGMPREELKSRLGRRLPPKVFHLVMETMAQAGKTEADRDLVRLAGYRVSLGKDQAETEKKMRQAFQSKGLTPPTVKEVTESLELTPNEARDMLAHLVEQGILVKVKDDLYFDKEAMDSLKERLKAHLREKGEITTPEFKDMTGASRKFVIPLLEWFDSNRVTLRVGDARKLREA